MKINSQYMHILYFHLKVKNKITFEEVIERLEMNDRIAVTNKISSNEVFLLKGLWSLAVEYLIKLLLQNHLYVRNGNEILGYCFTPQDGNSLLSSIKLLLNGFYIQILMKINFNV